MTDRPTISANQLADINESAASRLLRKFDKNPAIADSWNWTVKDGQWNIATDSETVQITNAVVRSLQEITCSCLLSPKCFHVLAVSNCLAIADQEAQPASSDENHQHSPDQTTEVTNEDSVDGTLTADHLQAANMMQLAVAEILSSGLRATGGSIQSKLLRAIHECRATGLHRLAAAGLRLINFARLARTGSEEFLSTQAVQSAHEALLVAHQITGGLSSSSPKWIGTARRRYHPVVSLKLFGLCCEPVLTASGYAGVITWMLSEQGDVVSVSDVQPGTTSRIPQAWKSNVTLAGLALSHADLSQQKLLISKATISDDGRVGGSDSAKAVPSQSDGWNCPPIAGRFAEPLTTQIQRYFDQQDAVGAIAREGAGLMFLTGTVCGYHDCDLILQIEEEIQVRLTMAADTKDLPYRDNLTLLCRTPGLQIQCLCRLLPLQPGHFQLLSISPPKANEPSINHTAEDSNDIPTLQTKSGVHIDLGLETLRRSQLSSAQKEPVLAVEFSSKDLLNPNVKSTQTEGILSAWLQAIVLGGRHALSRSTIKRCVQDAQHLKSNFQPTASQALKTLAQQAINTETTFDGLRFPADSTHLAKAWLAAAVVQNTAHQHQQHAAWQTSVESESSDLK